MARTTRRRRYWCPVCGTMLNKHPLCRLDPACYEGTWECRSCNHIVNRPPSNLKAVDRERRLEIRKAVRMGAKVAWDRNLS